jgi:geranylgeranyl pyrophosphate synthase
MAFEQLATMQGISPAAQVELIRLLANHSGSSGMVAGQAIDLAATGESLTLDQLKFMHTHKTGALIETSVLMGAVATTKATAAQLKALSRFARAIGLAFQIQDDILDVESSTAQLGKQQGSDAAKGKPTYIALLGLDDARAQVDELYKESIACLELFGDRAEPLRYIAGFIVNRAY